MRLSARIERLEQRQASTNRGWKVLHQCDDNPDEFYEEEPGPVDYRRGIVPTDHTGQRRYTRSEIDAMERAGWNVLLIQYMENWRNHDNVLAVVQPGLIDKLLFSED